MDNATISLLSGVVKEGGSGFNPPRIGILAEGTSLVSMLGGLVTFDGSGIGSDLTGILSRNSATLRFEAGILRSPLRTAESTRRSMP